MTAQLSPARLQPNSGFSSPASVYMTVSWSAHTRRPWRSVSSAVFTTTVRRSPRIAWRPSASFAPPTPPASATTGESATEERVDVSHPLDRLVVVGRRQADDRGGESERAVRRDRLGDELRKPLDRRTAA